MKIQKHTTPNLFLHVLQKFLLLPILCALLFASGCKRELDLTEYVSEYRNNLLLYSCDDFSVRMQNVVKEYPYVADGYKSELTKRVELTVTAPEGTEHCKIRFYADGVEHAGDGSYDSVKRHFYYSCTANVENAHTIPLAVSFDGNEREITLTSVKTEDLLPLSEILRQAFESEKELLKKLTPKKEFEGELYVRLLYEDAPFFYVGIVDRNGKVTALLLNGKTGKVLAKRTV